jgi:hypothetical protein
LKGRYLAKLLSAGKVDLHSKFCCCAERDGVQ